MPDIVSIVIVLVSYLAGSDKLGAWQLLVEVLAATMPASSTNTELIEIHRISFMLSPESQQCA
jgi:hypothetical protein